MKYIIPIFILAGILSFYLEPQHNTGAGVIAMSPAHSKMMKYFNLTDEIIAVSVYDKEPLVQDKYKLAGGIYIDQEELLKLSPSLVLLGDNNQETSLFLQKHGIDSMILPTRSLDDIYDSMIMLSEYFEGIDESVLEDYYEEWQALEESSPSNRRRALILLDVDPVYAVSDKDYLSEALKLAGWDSAVQTDNPYPVLSGEDLLSLTNIDDILIFPHLEREGAFISNILSSLNAENIVIIDDENIELPSPYILDAIKKLRIMQSLL